MLGKRKSSQKPAIVEESVTKKQKVDPNLRGNNINPEGVNVVVMPVSIAVAPQVPLLSSAAISVSAPATVSQPTIIAPVAPKEPEAKKAMSQEQVNQMLDDFNKKLNTICNLYDIQIADEDIRICSQPGVDQLLSFETKVNYLCDFFNTKHLELTNVILN